MFSYTKGNINEIFDELVPEIFYPLNIDDYDKIFIIKGYNIFPVKPYW